MRSGIGNLLIDLGTDAPHHRSGAPPWRAHQGDDQLPPRVDKDQPKGTCTVCRHPERARLEVLLAGGGASHRAVAKRFNLSRHAVDRHWMNHVTDERKACLVFGPIEREALAARVAEESESLIDHFKAVR